MKANHHGFSLVEGLLVFTILGALLLLAIPAAQRIKERSRGVVCVQQMRGIYQAIQLYTQDHRGEFPRANTSKIGVDPTLGQWEGVWYNPRVNPEKGVPGYLEGGVERMLQLVLCPDARLQPAPASTYNPHGYPYVCNYEIMTQNGFVHPSPRMHELRLEKTALLFDGSVGASWGYGVVATSPTAASWARVRESHASRMNVMWADGRVTQERKAEITTAQLVRYPR